MTRAKEMKLSLTGLTDEQEQCFRLGHCAGPEEHRWIGPNFPTPEGECPFCIDPEFLGAFQKVQVDLMMKDAAMPPRVAQPLPPVAPFQIPPPIAEIINAGEIARQRMGRFVSRLRSPRKEP